MKKRSIIVACILVIFAAIGWLAYQKAATADAHQGMSIVPEEHKDIPLYKGLKPGETQYTTTGDVWRDIHDYYMTILPKNGWRLMNEQSALQDDDPNNDWSGFISTWRKDGFNGELTISANYHQYDKRTEVMFDKTAIVEATKWIANLPETICIYSNEKTCTKINDQDTIKTLVHFINNEAFDWKKKTQPRSQSRTIDFDGFKVQVLFEKDKEIYLVSEKGTKIMKPEPEFLQLIK